MQNKSQYKLETMITDENCAIYDISRLLGNGVIDTDIICRRRKLKKIKSIECEMHSAAIDKYKNMGIWSEDGGYKAFNYADVITSWYSPISCYLKTKNKTISSATEDDLCESAKAFLLVCCSIGNFVPSVGNYSGGTSDNIRYKCYDLSRKQEELSKITKQLNEFEKINIECSKNRKKTPGINKKIFMGYYYYFGSVEDIIEGLYFQDYVQYDDQGEIRLKESLEMLEINKNNIKDENGWKDWFEIVSKLIVQRGYRITNKKAILEQAEKKQIQDIFKELKLSNTII